MKTPSQLNREFYKKANCKISYDSFGKGHIMPMGCLKTFHANYEISEGYNYAGEKFQLLLPKRK